MLNASTASRLPWRNATDERLDQRRDKKPMKLIKRMQIIIHCGTWHLCLIYWKKYTFATVQTIIWQKYHLSWRNLP